MDVALYQLLWQRAQHRCEYRQFPADVSLLPLQIDHLIAEKHRGSTTAKHLALSCERCNSSKGPTIAGYLNGRHVPLCNSRQDRWADHFAWHGPLLVGKTAIGTVTIAVLAINLPYRIALRAALIAEGVFPPEAE